MVDLKVALLSHEGGGISSVCHGLAHSLSKRGISTTVFSGTSGKCKIEKLNEFLEVIHLPFFDAPPRSVWFQLQNFRQLTKLLGDYSVIHGVSPDISAIYAFYMRKLRKPFVAMIHGTPRAALKAFINTPVSSWTLSEFAFNILEFPLHEFTIRTCLRNSNHVVACSFSTLRELNSYADFERDNVSVIYNGVNFDEIEDVKINRENTGDKSDFSIVYAGRLFWMKGVTFALKAFEIVRRDFKDVRLSIFGKGPLEHELKRRIRTSGLRDSVCFRGYVKHKELIAEVKKSDLVVLPSVYEAQPMFVLEAMACKKPVIVFDVQYAREIISNMKNGVLAKPFDVEDLYGKIALLLSDKDLRKKLGQNGYNYVKHKHNWDTQVEKYIEVYQKAIRTN